ncbi:16436_t:CDS:2, partial [Racocetra persica]
QENVPNSTWEKILKHKSLPLVHNNTGSFVKTQTQYNKENISLSEANQIVKCTETNNKSKRIGSGRRAFYPEAEKCLYMWIIKQRKQALAVTYEIMQNLMMKILQQPDM